MRLVTFNVLGGRVPGEQPDGPVDVDRFRAAVTALDADLLALQEVDRDQPRTRHADLTAVAAEATGAVEHRFVAAVSGTPGERMSAATGAEPEGMPLYGVALLSRLPVRSWQVVRLAALPGRVPFVWPGSRRPTLVRDEPRVAVVPVVATPLGDLTVATTHLSFLPTWNLVQLRQVSRALRRSPRPQVLMGDLNMPAGAAGRVSGLAPVPCGPTFPVHAPTRRIDHVLVEGPAGRAWRAARAEAVDTGLSDHRALVVDLEAAGR